MHGWVDCRRNIDDYVHSKCKQSPHKKCAQYVAAESSSRIAAGSCQEVGLKLRSGMKLSGHGRTGVGAKESTLVARKGMSTGDDQSSRRCSGTGSTGIPGASPCTGECHVWEDDEA